jgi:hypothetical protein
LSRAQDVRPYYLKHLAPLVGCEIIGTIIDTTDPIDVYTGYVLKDKRTGQEYELVALRDPEGNGPGHFSIAPIISLDPSKDIHAP